MGLALLFPGQGTQHAATLPWLDARAEAAATLQLMSTAIGSDWRLRLADPEWATENRVAQPLVTGLGIAAWQCLASMLPAPAVVAGYSVGELAAFRAAGVFDTSTAMALARHRAEAMDRSASGRRTGLLAVHGLAPAALQHLCDRHALSLAVRLGPDASIVGGLTTSLDAAHAELAATGGRGTRLAVHVASHTPWMAEAATRFGERLAAVRFARPSAPVVCNFGAAAGRDPRLLEARLAEQIANPVLWDACMESILERGVQCVLEVGPGSALSNMWRARYPDIAARSVDEFSSPEAAGAWVHSTLRAR